MGTKKDIRKRTEIIQAYVDADTTVFPVKQDKMAKKNKGNIEDEIIATAGRTILSKDIDDNIMVTSDGRTLSKKEASEKFKDKQRQMKCSVRPISRESKCPDHDTPFIYDTNKKDFRCENIFCGYTPKRFLIDVHHKGKRVRICVDDRGQALDSYERARDIQYHIYEQIKYHEFDASKYSKSERKEFYANNLLEEYYNDKIDKLAPSYKTDFKRYITRAKNFFKIQDVREIKKKHLKAYQKHLEKNFTLSAKSIKNIMDVFRAFLHYIKDDEVISVVPPFPDIEVETPAFQWLHPEDQIKLFEFVPDIHKPIIAFLMLHGCRPSEARALKVKNVDLRNQTIKISATFSGNVYREKRKGKKSRAVTVPMHPELLEYITEKVTNNLPEAFIFINQTTGRHYCKNTLQEVWNDVREKANIDKSLRLYDATRHSFASNLVNSGSTIYKVSKLLGHSSTKMTEKYSHSEVKNLRADMEKLTLKRNCQQTVNSKIAKLKKG